MLGFWYHIELGLELLVSFFKCLKGNAIHMNKNNVIYNVKANYIYCHVEV